MEFENREPRNERPQENSPLARNILIGLALLIVAVLAWGYFKNDDTTTQETSELDTVTQPDTLQATTPVQPAPTTTETVNATPPAEAATATVPVVEVPKVSSTKAPEKVTTPTEEAKPLPTKSVNTNDLKGETRTYTVGTGETFLGIANRYNMKLSTLQALNPDVNPNAVKSGTTKLKVKIQGTHKVGAGDILRVVANKYGVTVEQLMAVNKKKKNFAERGEELIIPVSTRQ
jgi:LysM repeat protein